MDKFKFKIFLWDQFIRPLKHLLNRHTLQSCLIALVMINFISFESLIFFWIALIIVLGISVIDVIQYWKSGEYISHYRKEKYPDYRKIIKEVKKKKVKPIEEKPKPIILDDNPLSIASYAEEFPENFEEISKVTEDEQKI